MSNVVTRYLCTSQPCWSGKIFPPILFAVALEERPHTFRLVKSEPEGASRMLEYRSVFKHGTLHSHGFAHTPEAAVCEHLDKLAGELAQLQRKLDRKKREFELALDFAAEKDLLCRLNHCPECGNLMVMETVTTPSLPVNDIPIGQEEVSMWWTCDCGVIEECPA
jgi:hypothetical protein